MHEAEKSDAGGEGVGYTRAPLKPEAALWYNCLDRFGAWICGKFASSRTEQYGVGDQGC